MSLASADLPGASAPANRAQGATDATGPMATGGGADMAPAHATIQHQQPASPAPIAGAANSGAGAPAPQASAPPRLPKINIYINKNEIRKLLGKCFNCSLCACVSACLHSSVACCLLAGAP